ncbi:Cyclopropane-fatty-acyl-phospholipid synthase [Cedecea neteri]|uniref:Cyclopropane-fatty-acyl-phospholipid synthase n=1 Tax=Cedecea neteri TaxID=158822 RepID=A0A2X3J9L4_9ENTR|nr:Cyclopropane-fatty-acyl-phospholipid synthase [Cedecea neteri]
MAQDRCRGLDVEILLQDYRDLNSKFDRIVSVGMFEHVGPKKLQHLFLRLPPATLKTTACFCCTPSVRMKRI